MDEDGGVGDTLRFMRSQIDAVMVLMQGQLDVENGGKVASSPMRASKFPWRAGEFQLSQTLEGAKKNLNRLCGVTPVRGFEILLRIET